MQFIIASSIFTLFSYLSMAQKPHDIRVSGNADLIKSDNDGFFEKGQGAIEINYYFSPQLSGTSGVEWWTDDQISLILGARWYPVEEAFVRIRGLIGERELSLGAGFIKPLEKNFHLETMADLYFSGHVAIRAGVAYVFKRRRDQ